ncbi:glycosyltransferase family 2 protein [Priestia megaterium]|uniref:glycosyltransferase family 2 protein n=1 Tax=Priestia megaterium TaxID=1404 RepID=UPI002079D07B|nr:glycosyltransferase family 2 protein [Priestia megaterium]USL25726.1 glycosyltransferase family 2 protein [Priestia megaterium]
MSKKRITIFTPTYNREFIIRKCYESLCSQSNQEFTWLIVDDGSTDNTEELINSFINEDKIEICYLKQQNRGKHVAHNTGVLNCKTDIFVCVDSDDYLSSDAVQIIYDAWDEVNKSENLAGVVALKGRNANIPTGTWMPSSVRFSSIRLLYEKHKFKGDAMLIFKSDVLKRNLFPLFEGEKFVTESTVYDLISENYEMKLLDKVLYFCNYLEDGYTRNIFTTYRNNPKGYMYYLNQRIELAQGIKNKYKAISYYVAGCFLLRSMSYYQKCNYSFLKIVVLPKALWIFLRPYIKNYLIKFGMFKIK